MNALPDKKPFKLYPNPSSGIITTSGDGMVNIRITDMSGKVVYKSENIAAGSSINLTALQKGFYMVQLTHRNTGTMEKLIIE